MLIVKNYWQLFSQIIGETLLIVRNIWRNRTSLREQVHSYNPRPLHTVNPLAPRIKHWSKRRPCSLIESKPALKTCLSSPQPYLTSSILGPLPIDGQGTSFLRSICGCLVNVREYIVKIRELWKRFTCYHCLRKERPSVPEMVKRAVSEASAGGSTFPTHLPHKASTGKRPFDMLLVREECPGKGRLSFLRP
jgi:hypothetical protein